MRWAEALLLDSVPNTSAPSQGQAQTQIDRELKHSPRHMNDSYSELILPFGSDPQLLEQYTNASGGIRMGKSVVEIYP
jgi:acyl-coenzyme A thioesterase 9